VHVSRGLHQKEEEHGEEHIHEAYGGFRMNEKEGEEGEHDNRKKDHRDEEHVQDRGRTYLLSYATDDFGEKKRACFEHTSTSLAREMLSMVIMFPSLTKFSYVIFL
jgi:hypothetical protein